MAKQYNIRWGRSDYAKLSHLTRKVNKKIFEIEVKRPDINQYQPDYLDYQELKKKIKTRRDFNNMVAHYERYLRDGVEEVVEGGKLGKASKWELNEYKIIERVRNNRKSEKLEKLGEQPVSIMGQDTGNKRKEMHSTHENSLKPTIANPQNKSREEFERAFRQMEREMFDSYDDIRRESFIGNYVKGLIAEGYSDELIEMMTHIDPKDFEKVFHSDEVATIDFIYDPQDLLVKNDILIDLWKHYANDSKHNNVNVAELRETVMEEYAQGLRVQGYGRTTHKVSKNTRQYYNSKTRRKKRF